MNRIIERELMDDETLAAAYAAVDFAASNEWFVEQLTATATGDARTVVDIGCGPADVALRLARRDPHMQITAVDGSASMVRIAENAIQAAGLGGRIHIVHGRIPHAALDTGSYDVVLAKDVLHHLADPMLLWTEVCRRGSWRSHNAASVNLARPHGLYPDYPPTLLRGR